MTQYIVRAPDGSRHIIEGPDQPAAPQQPQGADQGGLMSAVEGFANAATFGLDKPVEAAIGSAVHGIPYAQARANMDANETATQTAHPYASVVGNVAGLVPGAGVGGAVLRGAEAVPVIGRAAAAVRGAPTIPRVAATIATDSAIGAGTGYLQGGKPGAVAGAIAGPLARPIAIGAAALLKSPAAAAFKIIAKTVQLPDETIAQATTRLTNDAAEFEQLHGRLPTLAEMSEVSQSKEIANTIGRTTPAQQFATAQEEKLAIGRQGEMSGATASGGPTADINALATQRTARATAAMDPIRHTPVTLNQDDVGLLLDRRTRAATNGDPALQRKLNNTIADLHPPPPEPFTGSTMADFEKWQAAASKAGEPTSSRLTLDDIDALRKSLRGRQGVYANPQSSVHNPHTASSYGALADNVTQLGVDADSRYGDMLDQYESDSTRIRGFKHGLAGNDIGEAEKAELRDALTRPEGREGYEMGVRSRLTNQASASPEGAVKVASDLTRNAGDQQTVRGALPDAARVERAAQVNYKAARGMAAAVPRQSTEAEAADKTSSLATRSALIGLHGGSTSIIASGLHAWLHKAGLPSGTALKVAQLAMDPRNTPAVLQYLKVRGTTATQRHEFMDLVRSGAAASVGSLAGQAAAGAYPQ